MVHSIPSERVVTTDRRFLSRDPATPELLDVVGVPHEWAEYVRVLDRNGPFALLHYVNTWVSTDNKTIDEEPLKVIGHVRGTVINTDTLEIVCRSFPYTPEVVSTDAEGMAAALPEQLSNVSFFNACEGTVLRLFWADNEWHLSTHRKIDANNSYWAGPTFGELFQNVRQFEFDELNNDYCYVFLLSHNSNRLVYDITAEQLMLIAIYNRHESRFMSSAEYGPGFDTTLNPTGCVYPQQLYGIDSIADAQHMVDCMGQYNSFDMAGMIAIPDTLNPHPVKFVNPFYSDLRDARGNEPNLRSRYIHLRGTPQGALLVGWFTEPEYQQTFMSIELEIEKLVYRLHDMYIKRWIKKDFSPLPKEEFVTLQRCHSWHGENRSTNIVTKDRVREFVSSTPNHFLLIMLNRQKRENSETVVCE